MPGSPIHTRPWDWGFVIVASLFACTSLLFDTLPTLAELIFDDPRVYPLAPAGLDTYVSVDPLLVADPAFLRAAVAWSGFVWLPIYVYMAWAFYRGERSVRLPGLMYATGMCVAMSMVLAEVFFSSNPAWRTPEPLLFAAYNLPYPIFALLVGWRLRQPFPFGVPAALEGLPEVARRELGLPEPS